MLSAYVKQQTYRYLPNALTDSVNNLRLLQARPNWLKGKVCAAVDQVRGVPCNNPAILTACIQRNTPGAKITGGPNFQETWARSTAWTVLWYLAKNEPQYTNTANRIGVEVSGLTSDQALGKWIEDTLVDLHTKDKAFVRNQLMKPIGKDGDVFLNEDMTSMPDLPK